MPTYLSFQNGPAEGDGPALVAYGLVGQHRMRVSELGEALLGAPMRDDRGASILQGLASGDVIEMVVAVDQILDGLVGDLLDLIDVGLPTCRPPVGDRIGGDDAGTGDNEHRLMVDVAKDVDVIGTLDLRRLDWWSGRCAGRGLSGAVATDHQAKRDGQREHWNAASVHLLSSLNYRTRPAPIYAEQRPKLPASRNCDLVGQAECEDRHGSRSWHRRSRYVSCTSHGCRSSLRCRDFPPHAMVHRAMGARPTARH